MRIVRAKLNVETASITKKSLEKLLETNPQALNKLPASKRTENLVLLAVRPPRKLMSGPSDIRARCTIHNIMALHPSTRFSPKVEKEIINLVSGARPKDLKRMESVFYKQKRKMPDSLLKMIAKLEKRKTLASEEPDMTDTAASKKSTATIVVRQWYPNTLTVAYPGDADFVYDYYIGDEKLFKQALRLQGNPGQFSKFVKDNNFSVKKLNAIKY